MNSEELILSPDKVNILVRALRGESLAVIAAASVALQAGGQSATAFVAPLLQGMNHPDETVRRGVIHALGIVGAGSPEVVSALIAALRTRSLKVLFEAIPSLGRIGKGVPQVTDALIAVSKEDESVRAYALRALSAVYDGSAPALDVFLAGLHDPSPAICAAAAEGLVKAMPYSPLAVTALINVVNHSEYDVLSVARAGLKLAGEASPQALDALLLGLKHPDFRVRREIVNLVAVAGKGSDQAVFALLEKLKDENMNVYNWVPEALAAAGEDSPFLPPGLLRLLQDKKEDIGVRCRAIKTLGLLGQGTPEVMAALIAALHEPGLRFEHTYFLRFSAVEALGQVGKGSPKVIAALLPLLSVDTNLHCVATALAEAGQGMPEVARVLVAVIQGHTMDENRQSSMSPYSLRALRNVDVASADGVTAVSRALTHSDFFVREAAAEAMGTVGKGSLDDAQKLLPLLHDDFEPVRKAAAGALGKIGIANWAILEALISVLDHCNGETAAATLEALRLLGAKTSEAVEVIAAMLRAGEVQRRASAAQALGVLDASPEVIHALKQAAQDEEQYVQTAAARALYALSQPTEVSGTLVRFRRKFSPDANLDTLLVAIQEESVTVRKWASQAFQQNEGRAYRELAELVHSLRRQLVLVRSAVREALTLDADRDAELVDAVMSKREEDIYAAGIEALYRIEGTPRERLVILVDEFRNIAWGY